MSKSEILTVAAVAAVCAALCAVSALSPKAPPKTAVIYCNGSPVCRRDITEEGEFTVPELPDMVFEIADGGVRVVRSDCPDKLCVKQGLIKYEGAAAVCMPNKAAAVVEGGEQQ
ncbi:MAG: NusG domain II-containing protein [Ruminococcus sp.]|nr:NusG domain II-containing protein [Ruminococcus sp.]